MNMKELLTEIASTAELMGKQLSPMALAMMAKDLAEYDPQIISQALSNVRKGTKQFSLGAIIYELELLKPDGRVGADEAWALYPQDENVSAVITNEMAEAMAVAKPLLLEGDKVGARMAFKEAYNRIVAQNKTQGLPPKWFPSLGHSKEGREQALKEAVEKGRLTQDHALSLLPPPPGGGLENFVNDVKFLTNQEALTPEKKQKNHSRILEIKSMLAGKQP